MQKWDIGTSFFFPDKQQGHIMWKYIRGIVWMAGYKQNNSMHLKTKLGNQLNYPGKSWFHHLNIFISQKLQLQSYLLEQIFRKKYSSMSLRVPECFSVSQLPLLGIPSLPSLCCHSKNKFIPSFSLTERLVCWKLKRKKNSHYSHWDLCYKNTCEMSQITNQRFGSKMSPGKAANRLDCFHTLKLSDVSL